jgi:hypothetical protein
MPVPSLPDFGTVTRTTTSNAPILYAFLAAGREVLYVGQTTNPAERLRKHAYKPWWPDVAAFTWHPAPVLERLRALDETLAIAELNPAHNQVCAYDGIIVESSAERRRERLAAADRRRYTVDNWVDDLYERRPPRRLVGIA